MNIQGVEVLVSGGADAKIIFWNATTGEKIKDISTHTSSIQALAIGYAKDVFETTHEDEKNGKQINELPERSLVLFSAASTLSIHLLTPASSSPFSLEINPFSVPTTLITHHTTISAVRLTPHALYTCSLDHTCSCVELPLGLLPNLEIGTLREPPTIWDHSDYVRTVATSLDGKYVFTGGRDEDIYVWNAASADLVGKWRGHYDEIMALCIVRAECKAGNERLLSSGIDATIRVWEVGLTETEGWGKGWLKAGDEEAVESVEDDETEEKGDATTFGLTAEEEQELAELMDSE